MNQHLSFLDTTLRDGMQGANLSFSLSDKIKIAKMLDAFGMDYIEAGAPFSNPKDQKLFQECQKLSFSHAKLVAFGSTRHKDCTAAADAGLSALLLAETPVITIFGKASAAHVSQILQTTLEENLAMIFESIAFLKQHGRQVFFDAEHFFDGYRENPGYSLRCLSAAQEAGADLVCLCDTNGAAYFSEISQGVQAAKQALPGLAIGIHCHNDCGMAVANSMAGVDAGASQIQGTFLGFGERCGNANLSTILPNLQFQRKQALFSAQQMEQLTPLANAIAETANFSLPRSMPYVGRSAFAHKGGMHADGVFKAPASFEHVSPEQVGNRRKILISEVAGKSALLKRIWAVDPSISREDERTQQILDQIKAMEYRGYQFEGADASLELIIRRILGKHKSYFSLEHFRTTGEQPLYGSMFPASAMVKVKVGNVSEINAAEGNGPVHALDLALRKTLMPFYPSLEEVSLSDFKVRVLESDATTAATVRVLIESTDGKRHWCTIGVSTDIIEASFLALADSIEYKLMLDDAAKGGNQI